MKFHNKKTPILHDAKTAKAVTKCRICGNESFKSVVDLGEQRLSGVFSPPDSEGPPYAPLDLIRCDKTADSNACGLVQLRHSAAISAMYGATYGYYSSLSPTMVSHLKKIAATVLTYADPEPGELVLDIACNDGTLLNFYEGRGLKRYGMDPSSEKFAKSFQKDIHVIFDFFSEEKLREQIGDESLRIITSIAMFYDLDDPLSFMKQIRSLLQKDGVWALELSYLPLMHTNLTYDQICHEHVTYYGLNQIKWLMDRADLKILDVNFNHINGGSFQIIAAREDAPFKPESAKIDSLLSDEAVMDTYAPYERFRNRVLAHRDDILEFLRLAKAAGKSVLGYGASTKGNIVLNHCGVTKEFLPAICDANEEKFGLVTPGTGIPIISKDEARKLNPDYFLVFVWHFRKEILKDEKDYILNGGTMVFDLPRMHVVNKDNYDRYLNASFDDLAYSL